jgi:hypothetical protein
MNLLDDCKSQVQSFDDYFDQLAMAHPVLPQPEPVNADDAADAANDGEISLAA